MRQRILGSHTPPCHRGGGGGGAAMTAERVCRLVLLGERTWSPPLVSSQKHTSEPKDAAIEL